MTKAARRRGATFSTSSTERTHVIDIDDGDFLRALAGTHRVQRIPKGSSARHTSTCTIAVLDEIDVDAVVPEHEIEERFDRGGGKGGQHQNTTDSAVTLVHTPTGIAVHIEGRKQWGNRQEARRVLAERVLAEREARALHIRNADRRAQIDSERSAKTFTHNEQRSEVVDHSTGRKWRAVDFAKGKI